MYIQTHTHTHTSQLFSIYRPPSSEDAGPVLFYLTSTLSNRTRSAPHLLPMDLSQLSLL